MNECAHFAANTALCEHRSADFAAGTALANQNLELMAGEHFMNLKFRVLMCAFSDICVRTCVLSCVCCHMRALMGMLTCNLTRAFICVHLIRVLSHVCSHMCARMCAHMNRKAPAMRAENECCSGKLCTLPLFC